MRSSWVCVTGVPIQCVANSARHGDLEAKADVNDGFCQLHLAELFERYTRERLGDFPKLGGRSGITRLLHN